MKPRKRLHHSWLILCLAVAGAIALIDALEDTTSVLITLLVIPSLLACARLSRGETLVVACVCVGLAVLLGVPDEIFGDADHVLRISVVAVSAVLAVVIAGLREQRELAAHRLAAQHAVARTLAESPTLGEGAREILRAIGEAVGWQLGGLWTVDGDAGVLRCVETWWAPGVDASEFDRLSRALTFSPGTGLPGRVWARREPTWIMDVVGDKNFPRAGAAAEAGLHGGVGFPVTGTTGFLGVIEFFAHEVGPPEASLVELMGTFGNLIGEYIERVQAEDAVRASEARKTAMLESALDCVITMDHQGKVVEFNPAAERTFGYRREHVVGKEMATLIIPPALRDRHRTALARYVETGEGRLLGRRLEMTGMRSDGTEFPVEITITRIALGEPPMFTGYLRDITESKRSEEERERLLELEQVARRAAQRSRDELEAILQGVADGVTAQGPDGRLIYANEAAVRVLGYPTAEALLGTTMEEVLDRFDVLDEDGEPFPPEQLPARRALAGERPPEAVVDFRVRATGDERWLVVKAAPIVDPDGAVLMVINIFEDITEHKRSENAQRFLAEASELLSSSLDYDMILDRVARLAVPGIADWCVVDLLDDNGSIERVALAHVDPAKVALAEEIAERFPEDPEESEGVSEVIRTGEASVYPEITEQVLQDSARSAEHLELLRSLGLRSAMLVPMTARGRTLGGITFASGESRRSFGADDLALARELARRAAVAVDNARVYRERSYIARTLQESLLPPNLPQIPGVDVAARFRAAGEGTEVGGDFYDLFDMGRSGWAIVIGDVCGKGADAAAITALARYTLRAAAMQEEQPSRILGLLNDALLTQRGDKQFCTVAYGRLVTNSKPGGLLELACGGHPLPLVLHPDGRVESAGVPGTLLGVVPDPDLEDRAVELGPGDSLVLYTDGVTEARTASGMFGVGELTAVLKSSVGLDAAGIAERIEGAVLQVEDDPRDDIAILVVQMRQ